MRRIPRADPPRVSAIPQSPDTQLHGGTNLQDEQRSQSILERSDSQKKASPMIRPSAIRMQGHNEREDSLDQGCRILGKREKKLQPATTSNEAMQMTADVATTLESARPLENSISHHEILRWDSLALDEGSDLESLADKRFWDLEPTTTVFGK